MKNLLFCDIDGILRNLIHGITIYTGERYFQKIHDSVTDWNCILFGKSIQKWIKSPEPFRSALPYKGALAFVKKLKKYKKYTKKEECPKNKRAKTPS